MKSAPAVHLRNVRSPTARLPHIVPMVIGAARRRTSYAGRNRFQLRPFCFESRHRRSTSRPVATPVSGSVNGERMRAFIHRHLDVSVRLGEILFSLIMALGFTASVRLGLGEADNR